MTHLPSLPQCEWARPDPVSALPRIPLLDIRVESCLFLVYQQITRLVTDRNVSITLQLYYFRRELDANVSQPSKGMFAILPFHLVFVHFLQVGGERWWCSCRLSASTVGATCITQRADS
ncbi:hypothetical protein EVAR_101460_1 [Eumeta japonica]|uniref:Uncharacterized protein n=1 Tax=Eumeta variegata TaxID=151549 RepID=A0A4C1SH91_EUMVA|nr:hypothetical protein EVAR_101460_1 [Eumeta japonica]